MPSSPIDAEESKRWSHSGIIGYPPELRPRPAAALFRLPPRESVSELDEFISSAPEPYRKVPSRTLRDVMGRRGRIDLLHIDI